MAAAVLHTSSLK